MSEQLIIDGKELDLKDRIAIDIQGVDPGDITKTPGNYSKTIRAVKSNRNENVFGNPFNVNVSSPRVYEDMQASILSNGIPLIQDGEALLVGADKDNVRMNIIQRTGHLWNNIKGKKLADAMNGIGGFDFNSTWPSYITFPSIETFIDVNWYSGGRYNFNPYQKTAWTRYGIPFIKQSYVLQKVIEQAGYTFDDSYLTKIDGYYNNAWVSLQVPVGKNNHFDFPDILIKEWMHDMSQEDFVKSCLVQYCCVLLLTKTRATIMPFKSLVGLKAKANDWSSKIDEDSIELGYDTGYKVSNSLNYLEWDNQMETEYFEALETHTGDAANTRASNKGTVSSNNKSIRGIREMNMNFHPVQELTMDNQEGNPRQIAYIPCYRQYSDDSPPSLVAAFDKEYPMHCIIIPDGATTYKTTGGSNETWSGDVSNGSIYAAYWSGQESETTVSNGGETDGLSPSKLISSFWADQYIKFIKDPLEVKAKFNLRTSDVVRYTETSQFDDETSRFVRKAIPVYVEALKGYYLVKKISNFIAGEPCTVELIRI